MKKGADPLELAIGMAFPNGLPANPVCSFPPTPQHTEPGTSIGQNYQPPQDALAQLQQLVATVFQPVLGALLPAFSAGQLQAAAVTKPAVTTASSASTPAPVTVLTSDPAPRPEPVVVPESHIATPAPVLAAKPSPVAAAVTAPLSPSAEPRQTVVTTGSRETTATSAVTPAEEDVLGIILPGLDRSRSPSPTPSTSSISSSSSSESSLSSVGSGISEVSEEMKTAIERNTASINQQEKATQELAGCVLNMSALIAGYGKERVDAATQTEGEAKRRRTDEANEEP